MATQDWPPDMNRSVTVASCTEAFRLVQISGKLWFAETNCGEGGYLISLSPLGEGLSPVF